MVMSDPFYRLLRRVAAFRAILAPYPAAPAAAPKATALLPAIRAGMRAAKGKRPPFCLLLFLLFMTRPRGLGRMK